MSKTAIIIGAGPAGLTAAYELITRTDIKPVIIEKTNEIGGISKTVIHNGYRLDIGPHRFFSKSDVVMNWWQKILPIQRSFSGNVIPGDKNFQENNSLCKNICEGPDPEKTDRVMLVKNRVTRIFFLGNFYTYPITLDFQTLKNLGLIRIISIGWSYLFIRLFPIKHIRSLEDFFISRFGKKLYKTFFKDYTEKVWGVQCKEIPADWGAQRVKKLSVSRVLLYAIKSFFRKDRTIAQYDTDTSLIDKFLYPKLGAGQMWETVARIIEDKGGIIIKNSEVKEVILTGDKVTDLVFINSSTNQESIINGDYFFSSMPVKDLINTLGKEVPSDVRTIGEGLQYRDLVSVGLLLNKLKIKNKTKGNAFNNLVPDNWIYIQDRNVKVGRLQIFNNWSPYMIADREKVWIGLEYFCNEGDELWRKSDLEFINFAANELHCIGFIDKDDVIDSTLLRVPKAYPAYFGTYSHFDTIKKFTDKFENLFLIGRNGMHKYNNQDHSMLTAIMAVNNIISGEKSKNNIWNINTEEEYHESYQE